MLPAQLQFFFQDPSIAISNYYGELSFFSNSLEVRNANDILLMRGYLGGIYTDFEATGPQSILFLPVYNGLDNQRYKLLKMYYDNTGTFFGRQVDEYDIDMSQFAGRGAVDLRQSLLGQDTLATGELTACRHANGRDWWVLLAPKEKSHLYSILVTPSYTIVVDTMPTRYPMTSGLGQTVFSPDGSKFIRFNNSVISQPDTLDIFDFDRCTGQISNHVRGTVGSGGSIAGGAAISPSSQYLYVSQSDYVYQFDLWAEDVLGSVDTVAVYDGYTEWGFFTSRFYLAQLAPDGKIYLNNSSGVKTLHVINYPDLPSAACGMAQHSVYLPNNNAAALANHPYYRLGPLDGSPCDTLGLDNLPRAHFRTDRHPEDTLAFHFQDLSFYQPEIWLWHFGDGGSSTLRHPAHTYAGPGVYEVCLTVSNALGSDTHCRTLELGPVAVEAPRELPIRAWPNPVDELLILDLGHYLPLNGRFTLRDAAGRTVLQHQVLYSQARIPVAQLPPGLYFYELRDGSQVLASGKVVKV